MRWQLIFENLEEVSEFESRPPHQLELLSLWYILIPAEKYYDNICLHDILLATVLLLHPYRYFLLEFHLTSYFV